MRTPALITQDGFLDPKTLSDIRIDSAWGAPTLDADLIVGMDGDYEKGAIRDAMTSGGIQLIGKSGHSRVGLDIAVRPDAEMLIDGSNAVVPVSLRSLRAVSDRRTGIRDQLLTVLRDVSLRQSLQAGRLLAAGKNDALTRDEVMQALVENALLLGYSVDSDDAVQQDGSILLPLEHVRYLLCEDNFDEEAMRAVLRFGKHGLAGVQDAERSLQNALGPREFFVGGIRLSFGPYIAVIDSDLTDQRVMHLAARVLDGIRTTGIDVFRQVELFNRAEESIPTVDLRVRLRLYHGSRSTKQAWQRFHQPRVLRDGVSFSDATQIHEHPERLIDVMRYVSPTRADSVGAYGVLLSSKRSAFVDWQETPRFQAQHLANRARAVAAANPEVCIFLDRLPPDLAHIAHRLGLVGGEQNEGHACLAWALPDTHTVERLLAEGTGVFAFHDLSTRSDAFTAEHPIMIPSSDLAPANGNGLHRGKPTNNLYLDGDRFTSLQSQHRRGARFLMVRHAAPDKFGATEGCELPPEILEWDRRGVWLKPGRKEAFEKVDTMITMYGSHVKGMDDLLRAQIVPFAIRMKRLFGDSVAFVHGKGPGVMFVADHVARTLPALAREIPGCEDITSPIFTMGIGIDAERIGQMPNFHSDAQADFLQKDRLVRQKHMNDRSTINVFNIGGAGTLEELALTLCSQKLYKNIPAPLILVDPLGTGRDGGNLWTDLASCIQTLAERKEIGREDATMTVQLLQGYIPNFIHLVPSYDEAAAIIEHFARDPVAYYIGVAKIPKSALEHAYAESQATLRETGFAVPSFLDPDLVLHDARWSDDR